MTYEAFLERIPVMVRQAMGERVRICMHTIYKNNNLKKEALCILEEGCNVSPTIYLRSYYEELRSGVSMEAIVDEILMEYRTNRCGRYLDVGEFQNFEKVKNRIAYKLINYQQNQELLRDVPHRRFLDLAVVYYLLIENHFIGNGTALVHRQQMHAWQVSEEDLYHLASNNTDRLLGNEIVPMNEVILELMKNDLRAQFAASIEWHDCTGEQVDQLAEQLMRSLLPEQRYTMYVMSNRDKYLGAAALLNQKQLREFALQQGSGFFVLPSSIHEVILIPETEPLSADGLKDLLADINESEENDQEYLSHTLYYYDRDSGLQRV